MRLLVLGGTWFLGRTVAERALARGWDVSTFNRGRSGPDVSGVESVRGDRALQEDLDRLAARGPWDAVIDTSGFVPREVLSAARALGDVVRHYVFVSTVSVYEGWPVEPLTEDSPALPAPSDAGPDVGYDGSAGYPTRYGFGKAGAERAVLDVFGSERATVLRPGVILGPHEYVGRLPWWLARVHRGGRVLAPGDSDREIQPVDVRDAAAFATRCAENGVGGVFNVTAPTGYGTFGSMLALCASITGEAASFEWAPDDFLLRQGVRQWTELPLWRTYPGVWKVDGSRAHVAGMTCRPLADTIADTWEWMATDGRSVENERSAEIGLSPDRERSLLEAWESERTGSRDIAGG